MAGHQEDQLVSFEYWPLLPSEVRDHVLSFLSDAEKQGLVDVFPNMVNVIERLIIYFSSPLMTRYLDMFKKCTKVTSIVLYVSDPYLRNGDPRSFMVEVARVNQNLRSIMVDDYDDTAVEYHSQFRKCYIEAVIERDPSYDETEFKGQLSFHDVEELVNKYPNIQLKGSLNLDNYYGNQGDEFFQTKKAIMDMIEYVYIPDVNEVQEHLFPALSFMLPKLRYLEVGSVRNGLIKLLPLFQLPTIESVELLDCHDKDLVNMTFPNIKKFCLSSSDPYGPYLTLKGNQCILDVRSNPLKCMRGFNLEQLLTKVFPQVQSVTLKVGVDEFRNKLSHVGRHIPVNVI